MSSKNFRIGTLRYVGKGHYTVLMIAWPVMWQDHICRLSGPASELKVFSLEKSAEWVGAVLKFAEGVLCGEVSAITL